MPLRFEHVKNFLGKPMFDSYGRTLGRVVGFIVNARNEVEAVEVELRDGSYSRMPGDRVRLRNHRLTYIYGWKLEANVLERIYRMSAKRLNALDSLYKNGEITVEAYEKLKSMYKSTIDELEAKKGRFLEKLREKVEVLEGKIKELEFALANLKLQYAVGEIPSEVFEEVKASLEKGLEYYRNEKSDMERFAEIVEKELSIEHMLLEEAEQSKPTSEELEVKVGEQEAAPTPIVEKPFVVRLES